MAKHGLIRLMTFSVCVAVLPAHMAFTPAAEATGNPATATAAVAENSSEKISIRPVRPITMGMPGSGVVQAAGSQLTRDKNSIFAILSTKGLNPGWVYTAWFGIFNNPDQCATRPCSAADFMNPAVQGSRVNWGGRIIGADGSAVYAGFLGVGDTTSVFDGPGLLDPKHAEIHLVVRSHGTALMGAMLTEQLSLFNGGCPPNMCANVQISIHEP